MSYEEFLVTMGIFACIAYSIAASTQAKKPAGEPFSAIPRETPGDEIFIGSDVSIDQLRAMHHTEFEKLVGGVFEQSNYSVHLTGKGSDGGKDLVAIREGTLLFIECKQSKHPFGVKEMRSFDSVVRGGKAQRGYVVALAGFTKPALEHAKRTRKLKCIDGGELIQLVKGNTFL